MLNKVPNVEGCDAGKADESYVARNIKKEAVNE